MKKLISNSLVKNLKFGNILHSLFLQYHIVFTFMLSICISVGGKYWSAFLYFFQIFFLNQDGQCLTWRKCGALAGFCCYPAKIFNIKWWVTIKRFGLYNYQEIQSWLKLLSRNTSGCIIAGMEGKTTFFI